MASCLIGFSLSATITTVLVGFFLLKVYDFMNCQQIHPADPNGFLWTMHYVLLGSSVSKTKRNHINDIAEPSLSKKNSILFWPLQSISWYESILKHVFQYK